MSNIELYLRFRNMIRDYDFLWASLDSPEQLILIEKNHHFFNSIDQAGSSCLCAQPFFE